MTIEDNLTPSEESYFRSRGENAGPVLAENNRSFDTSTSKDRTSGKEHDFSWASPSERHFLETGDIEPAREEERARSPQAQREVQEQREQSGRESWRQYQARMDALEQQNLALIDRTARQNEKLNLINEAFEEPAERLRIAEADAEWARNNIRPDPLQDAYAAMEYDRRQVENLKQQIALRDRRDQANAHLERYRNEALQHEAQYPGYVAEIYPQFQHTLRQTLANANPRASAQQIEQLAVQQEVHLHDMARAQGRSPHELLHGVARDWGIESSHEREQRENWQRQRQAQQQRAQAEAAEVAHKREREQVRSAIIPLGIHELLYEPKFRHLKELARKHGLSPFNGTGMSSY